MPKKIHLLPALAALGLLVAVLAGMGAITVFGLVGTNTMDLRISARQNQLAALRARAMRLARTASGVKAGKADGMQAMFLDAGSTGIAGAELQRLLIALAKRTGGEAKSAQVLAAEKVGPMHKISVNLAMRTTIKGLRNFLYELETGTPLAFVSGVNVTTAAVSNDPDDKDRKYRPVPLQVSLRVSGYLSKGTGS